MTRALEDLELEVVARPGGGPDVRVEPTIRRVRGMFGGETVVDSARTLIMFERGHLPVYYFPLEDVRRELLEPSGTRTHCPRKGEAVYHSLRIGDRVAHDAAWRYPEPIESCPDISGHTAFYWNAMDSWWEEDDEVFVHARDPYHRVDVLRSSRHVEVALDGDTVADTRRPLLLLETGLPPRWYIARADVRLDLLRPTDSASACPYKGNASYFTAVTGSGEHRDVAWSYTAPIPECPRIEQAICFFNERVDLTVDGEPQERPRTHWTAEPTL
jgi:uncharacterized protein (DUF427 family)